MPAAEEIYADFLRRIQQGEPLDLNQLCEQHPQLANSLRQLHGRHTMTVLPGLAERQDDQGAERDPGLDDESDSDETLAMPETSAASHRITASYDQSKCYGVESEIGRGGMGVILRVWDENLKRHLAMKMIRGQENLGDGSTPTASPSLMARFVREAEITGQLDHPGVVPVHEIGNDEQGRQFFTMRLIQGESLAHVNEQVRASRGHWTQARVLEVIVKVCDTLAYTHSKGVIHRDLKPANIMVGQFGETYVMDWGLAKVIGEPCNSPGQPALDPVVVSAASESTHASRLGISDMTLDGSVLGTPAYMPPEQAKGEINELDARADIYAVGTMLYELLAHVRPYGDDKSVSLPRDILKAVNAGPPTPIAQVNPRVPSELVAICEKAMARSKEDRYVNMADMAEDLRAYLENRVVRAYKTGAFAEFSKWVRRNRGAALASAVAMVFLLAGLGAVIGVQRWKNEQIAAEKDARQAAFLQEQDARLKEQDARKLAEQQRRIAEGLLFASRSREALSQRKPASAILLALESLDRINSHEANNVLLAALDQHNEERLLDGHGDLLSSAVFSPDAQSILTASDDHTATLWDTNSGQRKVLFVGHRNFVRSAAFNHDGRLAVTASYDSSGAIWDVATGRRLHVLPHNQPVMAAQFSPDGSLVATAGADNQARIWDTESGERLRTLVGHTDYIHLVSFSSDGAKLLTGSADRTARVWDVAAGELITVLEGHQQILSTAQFSPDGGQVLTTAALALVQENKQPPDSEARLWDAETGEQQAALDAGSAAASAAFNRAGDRIAVGCDDGTVQIWDINQRTFTLPLKADGGMIRQVTFSPDGRSILAVTSSNTAMVWDLNSRTPIATMLGHGGSIMSARFNPDGTRLVTASRDGTARIWRTDHRLVMPRFRHPGAVSEVKFGRDRMVTRVGTETVVDLWSLGEGRLVATLPHSEPVSSCEVSDDGIVLLTVADIGQAYLWSTHDGELITTLQGTGALPTAIFGHDGETVLLSSFRDKTAAKWNFRTGKLLRRIDLTDTAQQIPGPEGRHLLTVGRQFDLRLLDLDSGKTVREFGPSTDFVRAQFSPDGKILWTFRFDNAQLELWQSETGKRLSMIDVGGPIQVASFTPDGKSLLVAAKDDRSIRRCSVATGEPLEILAGAASSMDAIFVSPDGTRLVTRATDNTARLWNLQTGELICLLGGETRIEELRFSPDSLYLLCVRRATQSEATPGDSAETSVFVWDASQGLMLSSVRNSGLMRGECFTPDGKWFVAMARDQQNTVRFWPLQPAALARRFMSRTLTVEERELHQIGTPDERAAVRRLATLDSIYATLALLRFSDTAEADLQTRIQPFLDRTLNELLFELGSEASAAELQEANAQVARLFESQAVANPSLLTWLADLFELNGDRVQAIEILERAVESPAATASSVQKLNELRQQTFPDLVSFATIDAVLAETDVARMKRLAEFRQAASLAADRLRVRYLDARLAQNEERFADAIPEYRAIIEESAPRPEPYLHLAECLRASHEQAAATQVLFAALAHPSCRTAHVWNRWIADALADGDKPPAELLKSFPTPSAVHSGYGGSQAADLRWLLQQLADGQAIRINCGGETYVDAEGNVWAADRFFTHGSRFFGGKVRFTQEIHHTISDPLYQTERYFDNQRTIAPAGYQIPLPAGRYRVKLHFAEIYEAGVRLFEARIESQPVVSNYDPSAVGFATADVKSADVEVRDGLLNITFTATKDTAKVSAIEIESLDLRKNSKQTARSIPQTSKYDFKAGAT